MSQDTDKIIAVGFVAVIYVGMAAYFMLVREKDTVEPMPTSELLPGCRSCHSPLKFAAKYCPKCGKKT